MCVDPPKKTLPLKLSQRVISKLKKMTPTGSIVYSNIKQIATDAEGIACSLA